jgi:hypothetical protein
MKKLVIALVICVLALIGVQTQTYLAVADTAPQFEYDALIVGDNVLIETLNVKGAEGWKTVNARRAQHSSGAWAYEVILMRKAP